MEQKQATLVATTSLIGGFLLGWWANRRPQTDDQEITHKHQEFTEKDSETERLRQELADTKAALRGSLVQGPIIAKLNYTKANHEKQYGMYAGREGEEDNDDLTAEKILIEKVINDGRLLMPQPSLESKGFELINAPTTCKNFLDDEEVKGRYYSEMEAVVKELTGADKVLVFDHTMRTSSANPDVLNNLNAKNTAVAPAMIIHGDYSKDSGPLRLEQIKKSGAFKTSIELSEADWKKRFMILNVWRSVTDSVVTRMPLAFCDPHSVKDEDIEVMEIRFPDRTGEVVTLTEEKAQSNQWYYYPQMSKDEIAVFKTYSQPKDPTKFVLHTAFKHPATPEDAPERTSIELRTMAFFND